MTTTSNFDAEHTASIALAAAGRYYTIAWATKSAYWAESAFESLTDAACALGYTLTPITTPAEDHEAALARRRAEDGPAVTIRFFDEDDRPLTFATTDEGRR